jgi:hypothetical protein
VLEPRRIARAALAGGGIMGGHVFGRMRPGMGAQQPVAHGGTSVRLRMKEAIIAKTTALAMGEQEARHAGRKNIGTKAMQMHSSDTKAGCTICARHPDGVLHTLALFQVPVDVLDGHGGVVHQDAHRQRQAAQRHDVERLARQRQAATAARMASGIEVAMIVERHEPRNSRIIRLVSAAAITPSRTTPETAAFTNSDWSDSRSTFRPSGRSA